MLWFTSDTHFGHAKVIEYSNRKFSNVHEMDQALIKNWNAVVNPHDVVWHLGDFGFCKFAEIKNILLQLNGKKNFIFGNHDKEIEKHKNELLNENFFESIQHYKKISYNGQNIILLHYGMRVWEKSHHGAWHLFGHSHNSLPPHGKSFDVGVDSKVITPEYRPISFDEVKKYMDTVRVKVVDHHGSKRD